MNKTDKIYVAGHRGLVGSAIWKNLQEKGYTNLVGRTSKELDLKNAEATSAFFNAEKPDYVILSAARVGGIVANNVYRADFIHENLAIQQNVIDNCYRTGVKKLLFLGSTCIYPKDAPQPIKEDSLLTGPLEITNEPYAIAKIAGIKATESFNLQYGTNYISAMPTNLYGPNDNFNLEKSHVLPALIRKFLLANWLKLENWMAIKGDLDKRPIEGVNGSSNHQEIISVLARYGVTSQSVEIWGSGQPLREFLWSEDMADACVFLMERIDFSDLRKDASQKRNFHINIGTGREISIKGLAELIKEKIGYTGDIVFNRDKPDGTMRKLTDVSKIHALGWQHSVDIDEGISKILSWYL
ncbi:GDP-L-fucose synthase [Niabella insulamsoli]|uniref:GDP-L-fucose synthase family protein n=1 Tax=Niabella insulamsoli TaxID=3144874 RepID=UPI0031FE03BE